MQYSDGELQAFLDELGIEDRSMPQPREDLTRILHALARIVLDGAPGAGSYLILDCDGVYVQFAGSFGETNLILEAVSNHYLPADRQLSPHQVQQLLGLGFAAPARGPGEPRSPGSPNFKRMIDIGSERRLFEAAVLAVTVLRDIYRCCEDAEIECTLRLEVWPPDAYAA